MLRFAALVALVLGAPAVAFLALAPQTAEAAGPAMLVFLLSPAIAGLALSRGLPSAPTSATAGAGATSALAFAGVSGIILLALALALATGAAAPGAGWTASVAIQGAVQGAVTSTLEELGWASGGVRVARAAVGRRAGVVALGLVWAAWHLVVYALGPPEVVAALFGTDEPLGAVRLASFTLGCVAFRGLLTAVRDRADSLWPAAAGHAAGNLWMGLLLGGGAVRLVPEGPWVTFPGPSGLGFLVLVSAAAWGLRPR